MLLPYINPIVNIGSMVSKTCVKSPLTKRPKIVFKDQLLLNSVGKYCRMLEVVYSAILSNFIKLPFVFLHRVYCTLKPSIKFDISHVNHLPADNVDILQASPLP